MNTSNVYGDKYCEIKFKYIEQLEGRFDMFKGLNKKIRLITIKRTYLSRQTRWLIPIKELEI